MGEWNALEEQGLIGQGVARVAQRGSFSREDLIPIQYCLFQKETADKHVVLLTGWDESFIKYGEVIQELLDRGFNIYTMDWRSQGLSGRLVPDPQLTHVRRFDEYLHDLSFFISKVVCDGCQVNPRDLSVMAHSMGGLLALMMAARSDGDNEFQRLVVCSPMLRMKAGMPHSVAYWLGRLMCWLRLGEYFAPGESHVDVNGPMKKRLTSDKKRLESWEKIRRAFPLVAMGGMSNQWVVEAIRAQDWFKDPANSSKVNIPVLLLECEVDDFVCTKEPFSELCESIPDCRRIYYPRTFHEILFERDWARTHAMDAVIKFLETGERAEERLLVVNPPGPEDGLKNTSFLGRPALLGLGVVLCATAAAVGVGLLTGTLPGRGGQNRVIPLALFSRG